MIGTRRSAFSSDRQVLANGLVLLHRQSRGVPLAAGTLLLRSGALDESLRQAGLANLALELMLQGTRRRSARQIAEELESMGASLGVQVAEDYTDIGFVAPADVLGRALEILISLLVEPSFPPEEIQKERASVLAGLESRKDTLFNRAYDAFNRALYGSHPYGRPVDGNARTIKHLTRKQFMGWHRTHVRPEEAILSVISPFSNRRAEEIIERRFRVWRRSPDPLTRQRPAVSPLRQNKEVRLESRFEQAYLMTGVLAPPIGDLDYPTLKVLNTLLGGGMSSRLFLTLREEMGLAYEVASFYPTRLATSQWILYMGLPPEKLVLARNTLERVLDKLVREGPRKEEVQQAIEMIKGSYLMEHQTRHRQAWYAAWWELLGKGYAYDKQFLKSVESISADQVRTLARRLLARPRVTVQVAPKKTRK